MPNDERILETMPDGALGLIPLKSCEELGARVDQYLVGWREKREHAHKNEVAFKGYHRDSYIISTSVPRFGTGEAKVGAVCLSSFVYDDRWKRSSIGERGTSWQSCRRIRTGNPQFAPARGHVYQIQ